MDLDDNKRIDYVFLSSTIVADYVDIPKDNIYPINTSCLTLEGINTVHKKIVNHIAQY